MRNNILGHGGSLSKISSSSSSVTVILGSFIKINSLGSRKTVPYKSNDLFRQEK